MTLREQFEQEVKDKTNSNLELLFEASDSNYIKWLENKIRISQLVNILNKATTKERSWRDYDTDAF